MEINAEILALSPPNVQVFIASLQDELSSTKTQLDTYQKRCAQYMQAYEQLEHQIKELLRYRFGKKSERYIDETNPQLLLFASQTSSSAAISTELAKAEKSMFVAGHCRKKHSKQKQNLPRRIEIIPVKEADKHCQCGRDKTVIRYEIKELLHYEPPVHEIIEQRREVVACKKGCDGAILTAPAPKHILPKAKASEEFLASLIVGKIVDRQPLYHLERQLQERYGVKCSRQTMARWLIEVKPPLQPLYNLFKDEIIAYDIGSCDATNLQVLRESGRAAETKSYVYCMRGGPPEKAVILYDYNDKQHKQFLKNWYAGYHGYLHVDGDSCFDLLNEGIILSNCNAHGRRKFEPIAKATQGNGLAKEALHFFKALYHIERQAKNQGLSDKERFMLRQNESKPIMNKFKQWLEEMYPIVLPQSPLGKAMNYCIKLWKGLARFLEDGRLEIDNNMTEQEIKPFVMSRKNFLFATSVDGAKALCLHFSLVRTARCHGLEPYHYYVKLLKEIPYCQSVEDYEKLLPWNISKL